MNRLQSQQQKDKRVDSILIRTWASTAFTGSRSLPSCHSLGLLSPPDTAVQISLIFLQIQHDGPSDVAL